MAVSMLCGTQVDSSSKPLWRNFFGEIIYFIISYAMRKECMRTWKKIGQRESSEANCKIANFNSAQKSMSVRMKVQGIFLPHRFVMHSTMPEPDTENEGKKRNEKKHD